MGSPLDYFVNHDTGTDDTTTNDGSVDEPWATVKYALTDGVASAFTDPSITPSHDSNGVRINIMAAGSLAGTNKGEIGPIDVQTDYKWDDGFGGGGSLASGISHSAPLIFRGCQSAMGDWYPGKSGDAPTLYGHTFPPTGSASNFPIVSDGWDQFDPTSYGKASNHILFYDLVFDGGSSTHPHVTLSSSNAFVNCEFKDGGDTDYGKIQLTSDNTFLNCHFLDMVGSTSSSNNQLLNHAESGLTMINCVFDAITVNAHTLIKTLGTGSCHLIGNVFMCGDGTRVLNWGGTPSGADPALLVLVSNTFYSQAVSKVGPIGGANVSNRMLAIDNLTVGWSKNVIQKSNNNMLAWGGNSAQNNTTNFPSGTNPDVWFEFQGGNFDATDANSNKSLSQSPFLDATTMKMSCRPARTSGGDEAVVGQGLSLNERADTIVKRGDRGAVPRGPLNPPVDGGIVR